MTITKVLYGKVFNLGDYSNEKVSVEFQMAEGENASDCMIKARQFVELHSSGGKQKVQQAQAILAKPDLYRGIDVENAKELMKVHDELVQQGFMLPGSATISD